MSERKPIRVLAGDIGGTHTRLGIFTAGCERPRMGLKKTFSSKNAEDLGTFVERFLRGAEENDIGIACFGIAGPVEGEKSRTTNLPWEVDGRKIRERFGFDHVHILNDVGATIRGVPFLTEEERFTLNRGDENAKGVVGLVAPGTGLGAAFMSWSDGRPVVIPTEAGHGDFAPGNEREIDLWRYLRRRFGHVSIERVASGPGLLHIYNWLRKASAYDPPAWLSARLEAADDPPRVITEAALKEKDPLCSEALNTFVSLLGGVCGNLALTGLTLGGLYLGGGIPPRILPALKQDLFMNSFTRKGRFRELLSRIPVHVILNDTTALLGAAHCALSSSGSDRDRPGDP
jgi:glucokinase